MHQQQAVVNAQNNVAKAQEKVNSLKDDGTDIDAREALQLKRLMERQEDLVKRQEEGEDVTLELEVAQLDYAEALQKAQEQSRSYHDAVRELERAEADLVDQEDKSEKARQRMIEMQHKQTEAINKTTSKTVEYALAIQEAQDALDNFSPAGYERALKELEKITGTVLYLICLAK